MSGEGTKRPGVVPEDVKNHSRPVDKSGKRPALATRLVHSEYTPPSGFASLTTPVHHVSTVVFPNVAETRTRSGPEASPGG